MAQTSSSLDQERFNCPICLDILKDPVSVPCGHSYCMGCIKGYWDKDDITGVYSCPQCRQTFTPRPALNKNTVLAEVMEKLEQTGLISASPAPCYAGPGEVACDFCTGEERKAVKTCLVCLASYCEAHLQQHYQVPPLKKHTLVKAIGQLQEKICHCHNKLLEVYCCTDEKCICYQCLMDGHRGHHTVSAEAQRTKLQKQLGDIQREYQQRIQEKEKGLQELRQAKKTLVDSAKTALEESERIFTELVRSIERKRLEVTEMIRDQEKAAVTQTEGLLERLEQEIAELRRRDAELEQLSRAEDHIHFLQSYQSVCTPPGPSETPSISVVPVLDLGKLQKGVSDLREKLEDFCEEEWLKSLKTVSEGQMQEAPGPKTREEFLQYFCKLSLDFNTANNFLQTDWESVMHHFHEDSHLMQVHEAMVDLISGRAARYNTLDPFNHGILLPGYLNIATVYDEEDEYSDDDSDYEDHKHKKEYCGFSKNFLDHASTRSRSPHLTQQPYKSQITEIMYKEAEKNAKELVEEEERCKEKAEKKRLKKMRQKERKRQEKEKENAVKNKDGLDNTESEKSVKSQSSSSAGKNIRSEKEGVGRPPDTGPGEAQEKSPDASVPVESTVNSNEEDSEEESVASEPEELDMNSCFVSKAATIAMRKLEVKVKTEKKEEERKRGSRKQQQEEGQERREDQQNADVPHVEDVVMRSMELAVIGNQLAATGRYEVAVKYFTDAIKYNPKEFRLFGNRSFCYERMQQYEKSLTDADITLTMRPGWIKGLYRRGRALAGLKRYCEAALAFKEVLKLDSSCTDAAQELMRVQIMQLMEMGFSREQSSNALIIHGTVEKALEAFSNFQDGQLGASTLPVASAVQPAEEEWSVAGQKAHSTVSAAPQPQTQAKPKPRPAPQAKPNPAKPQRQPELFPIWVGNLIPSISDKMIHQLFSTTGEIHSVKVLRNKRCAFINYINKEDCEKAILKMNRKVIQGTTLLVRYPDKIHTDLGVSKSAKQDTPAKAVMKTVTPAAKKSSDECFFWRTTGCTKKESCMYQHIPKNKGIDRGQDKSAS
ncbi:hypothetical protein MATL_G00224710 [Megalops atlanticus]|uniref:Uncharacterized protein n=1 Tax=Megalops atlanticus TaxID=7932 RepID=A0A9D3SWI3_MEGAT|nr:hypothetical protein MATL_G00224710 [Megalops atlanticus]